VGRVKRAATLLGLPVAVAAGALLFVAALTRAPAVTGAGAAILLGVMLWLVIEARLRLLRRANRLRLESGQGNRSDPRVVAMFASLILVFAGLLVVWLVHPWH
jgi:hypothetical protein